MREDEDDDYQELEKSEKIEVNLEKFRDEEDP